MSEIFVEEITVPDKEKITLKYTIDEIKKSMKFWGIFPDKGINQRVTIQKIFETILNQYLPSSVPSPTEIKYYFHSPNQIEVIGLYKENDLTISLQIITSDKDFQIFIGSNSNLVYSLLRAGKS
ncbi:MAG: hypothetical protein QXK48_00740 [Candidatus Aenigmatarchaeota archaeon]